MHSFPVFMGFLVLWAVWYLQALATNYRRARRTGFPIYVSPVNQDNLFWLIFSVPLRPLLYRFLPAFAFDRIKVAIYGWDHSLRNTVQERLGSTFLLVTPGKNELWVADAEIAQIVLQRRKDFVQLDISKRILGLFGPNIITVNATIESEIKGLLFQADGDDWQRQRRIIAPVLNEGISGHVWRESSGQAQEMLERFTEAKHGGPELKSEGHCRGETDATLEGLRTIAINVLLSAGYGVSRPWKLGTEDTSPGHNLTYIEAISIVVHNYLVAALIPARLLCLPVMPAFLRKLGAAVLEFPVRTMEMVEKERKSTGPLENNMMSVLVKASDEEKKAARKDAKSGVHLSEDEITGNLYQFTIAGFDTTANTMAYAMTNLAIYPEWQDWIIEEIDQVSNLNEDLDYERTFPALKRCLALMYETMRLYTPVAHVSRFTASPQQMSTSSQTFYLHADTKVFVSGASMHVDSKVWGSDALSFRPTRWLSNDSIVEPVKGTYIPWSGGPRGCPGIKMSQVEFVAVMLTIFRSWKVEPIVKNGETIPMAQERLKSVMADSQPMITLQMNKPREVKLKWTRKVDVQ